MGTIDNQLLLATDQGAITASAASTDLVQLGADKGVGRPAYMRITVTTTGTGAGTVTFAVQDCATVGGTYVTKQSSAAFVSTTLTKGRVIKVPIPDDHEEFVRGYMTVASTVGALKVTIDITAG